MKLTIITPEMRLEEFNGYTNAEYLLGIMIGACIGAIIGIIIVMALGLHTSWIVSENTNMLSKNN